MRFNAPRALLNLALAIALTVEMTAATGCTRRKEVWIYTSLPKDVIAEMVDPLQAAVPGADVKWYQSASENVASRLDSELESDSLKADLVVTSDPFWYLEMKRKGRLLPYASPAAKEIPAQYRDPEDQFAAMRLSLMVLAYNSTLLKPADLPERWKDLAAPRFDAKVSMATPLDSAPAFFVLSTLSSLYGWEYFASLRKQGLVAEGTHSSVLTRIETGERPVGIVPLDAVLRGGARNKSIKFVYPQDGPIGVPGMVAILKETDHAEVAQRVYDWFFSAAAQAAIAKGGSYSLIPKGPAPEGARPWAELQPQLAPWTPASLREMQASRDRVRAKFSEVVLH